MSLWHMNAGDPIADQTRSGWSREGDDIGVQLSVPTFLELTTGPKAGEEPPWDEAAYGTFMLSRRWVHSAGIVNLQGGEQSELLSNYPFNENSAYFPLWSNGLNSGETSGRRLWYLVCRQLHTQNSRGGGVQDYRSVGFWAFYGLYPFFNLVQHPAFVYGNNKPPDEDDFNPSFGSRLKASWVDGKDEWDESNAVRFGMPEWVEVQPWFP